ncbi:MAG: polyprenol monophosphomannose synthase [Acidimicrobiales bacterium]
MRTLVVMPTYDEALNIVEALTRVRAAVPDADVLVVDDNSPDGTAGVARATGAELGQIEVLVRPHKDGLGSAYRHGFRVGLGQGYERLVQIDADLSHDPAALPSLLRALDEGAAAVIGSRYVPGGSIPNWPWHRRALSRWGNRYACAVLGMSVHDATAGYRAYDAATLVDIDVLTTRAKGYGFQIETAYRISRAGRPLAEVPIIFTDRVRGQSKMSFGVMVEELGLVTWWGLRDRVRNAAARATRRR